MQDGIDPVSATTISHYVRLRRCERYLHFNIRRDEMRALSRRFEELGVESVRLAPTLRAAGEYFEQRVVAELPPCAVDLSEAGPEATLAVVQRLAPGEECVLVQAPLQGDLGGWPCHGKADLVRARRVDDGALDLHVADIKASREARVEHKLQVAFYLRLLRSMLNSAGEPVGTASGGVVAMGVGDVTPVWDDAAHLFDLAPFDLALGQLFEGAEADVARIAGRELAELDYTIDRKCEGCRFNQICMADSAERQDVTIVPTIRPADVRALRANGVRTLRDLAELKTLPGPSRLDSENVPCVASSLKAMLSAFSQPMVPSETIAALVGIAWERRPTKRNAAGDWLSGIRSLGCNWHYNDEEEPRACAIF